MGKRLARHAPVEGLSPAVAREKDLEYRCDPVLVHVEGAGGDRSQLLVAPGEREAESGEAETGQGHVVDDSQDGIAAGMAGPDGALERLRDDWGDGNGESDCDTSQHADHGRNLLG